MGPTRGSRQSLRNPQLGLMWLERWPNGTHDILPNSKIKIDVQKFKYFYIHFKTVIKISKCKICVELFAVIWPSFMWEQASYKAVL